MNPQLGVLTNRHFWMGVAATFIVGVLVAMGVPNLMRTHMSKATRNYAVAELVGAGGGGGDANVQNEPNEERGCDRLGDTDRLQAGDWGSTS